MGGEQSRPAHLYAKPLEGTQQPMYTLGDDGGKELGGPIMRAIGQEKELIATLKYEKGPQVTTLYDNFQRGLALAPNRPCLGSRMVLSEDETKGSGEFFGDYEFYTYTQIQEKFLKFGSGMINLNLAPEKNYGEKEGTCGILGLYMKNRLEWVIAEQACNAWSKVTCPLYDTLGVDAARYSINLTEMETVVCSADLTEKVLKCVEADPASCSLKNVVQCEDFDSAKQADIIALAEKLNVKLYSFNDVMESGKQKPQEINPPKPEDNSTICFTSGTTGNPKGVLLTHKSIIACVSAVIKTGLDLNYRDIHLSYLPLAHMFERAVQCAAYSAGARIGFYSGDTKNILLDIKALGPTIFPSVPRLYNKIYDKINLKVSKKGGIAAALFNSGIEAKKYWLEQGHYSHSIFDTVVFNKAKGGMGLGNVRLMITGAAPISAHVLNFMRCFFGCPVLEGYGQTETSAAATITVGNDTTLAHVGGPLGCVEIALVSVPEMGYKCTDTFHGRDEAKGKPGIPCMGRGEICFRGNNVFKCYFKNKEKTDSTIDPDGWLHSGDIGIWLKNGCLKIVDRKKNIFKLAQGEYVAAEKLENIYCKSAYIAQMFVHGDSLHSSLCGIIVPDIDFVASCMDSIPEIKDMKKDGKPDLAEICKNEKFREIIKDELKTLHKSQKLHGFERIRYIHLCPIDFGETTPKLLTPTFKLKRKPAREYFEKEIEEMYAAEAVAGQTGAFQK